MSPKRLQFEEVREFCAARPVELSIARGHHEGGLALHGEFEGHSDFFLINVDAIQYAELPGTCWVGGLHLGRWQDLAALKSKWAPLRELYSGSALAFWDDDARTLADAPEAHCFAIVAESFTFTAGKDWSAPRSQ